MQEWPSCKTFLVNKILCSHVLAGNVGGAFPTPYDVSNEVLPTWAIAVVTAAGGVTLLWVIAIILLVCVYILSMYLSEHVCDYTEHVFERACV